VVVKDLPTADPTPAVTTAEPTEPRVKDQPTADPTPEVTTAEPTEPRVKDLPTADPTLKVTMAEPTEPPDDHSVLSRCVACAPDIFASDYWGRAPLFSSASSLPRGFGDLLSADMVDELIAERGVRAPFIRLAKDGDLVDKTCYLGPAGFGAEIPDQVDSAKVLDQFACGATIVLQGLHRLWPPLIDFARQAVDELGHPVQVNAYITPADSRGFDPHYDVHDVFVLQVAGSKRWVVHTPVHDHPLPTQPWTQHRAAIAERAAEEPVIDTTLSAGDTLYLPRGWLHSASAIDTTSIHLTVGVSPTTRVDVARAVVDRLASSEAFRRSLPMTQSPTNHDEIMATVTKVMAEMIDTLRDEADDLSEGAATQLLNRYAGRTRPIAVRPLATMAAAERAETVRVRWRHGLIATLGKADNGRFALRLPDRTITFPDSCARALETLLHGHTADAATLTGLDRADGAVLIKRLLREGVVVPQAEDAPGATAR
jgi:ribosomal protein L16 Arg81 hydroxylase